MALQGGTSKAGQASGLPIFDSFNHSKYVLKLNLWCHLTDTIIELQGEELVEQVRQMPYQYLIASIIQNTLKTLSG